MCQRVSMPICFHIRQFTLLILAPSVLYLRFADELAQFAKLLAAHYVTERSIYDVCGPTLLKNTFRLGEKFRVDIYCGSHRLTSSLDDARACIILRITLKHLYK